MKRAEFAQTDFFKTFSPDSQKLIWEQSVLVDFPAGTSIIKEGEHNNCLYMITHGKCSVHKNVEQQQGKLVEIGKGEVFGEMSLIDLENPLCGATISTLTDSTLLKMPIQNLKATLLESELNLLFQYLLKKNLQSTRIYE